MNNNGLKNVIGTTLLGLFILAVVFYGWWNTLSMLSSLFYYGIFVGLIIGVVAGIFLVVANWIGGNQNQKLQQITGGGFTLAAVSVIFVVLGRWFGV